jgi:hypothetical protein
MLRESTVGSRRRWKGARPCCISGQSVSDGGITRSYLIDEVENKSIEIGSNNGRIDGFFLAKICLNDTSFKGENSKSSTSISSGNLMHHLYVR